SDITTTWGVYVAMAETRSETERVSARTSKPSPSKTNRNIPGVWVPPSAITTLTGSFIQVPSPRAKGTPKGPRGPSAYRLGSGAERLLRRPYTRRVGTQRLVWLPQEGRLQFDGLTSYGAPVRLGGDSEGTGAKPSDRLAGS